MLTSSIHIFLDLDLEGELHGGCSRARPNLFLVQLLNELNLGYLYLKVRFGLVWFGLIYFFFDDLLSKFLKVKKIKVWFAKIFDLQNFQVQSPAQIEVVICR